MSYLYILITRNLHKLYIDLRELYVNLILIISPCALFIYSYTLYIMYFSFQTHIQCIALIV